MTLESFTHDVEAVLQSLGYSSLQYVHFDLAIAFEGGCEVIYCSPEISLKSHFGQINKIATKNMGIGDPADAAVSAK